MVDWSSFRVLAMSPKLFLYSFAKHRQILIEGDKTVSVQRKTIKSTKKWKLWIILSLTDQKSLCFTLISLTLKNRIQLKDHSLKVILHYISTPEHICS